MVEFMCPNGTKGEEDGLGAYITFTLSHSVNSQTDAEAVYKKVKEQIENAQITVPASEEISHAEVEEYIKEQLEPYLEAYGVTGTEIVSLKAEKADLTSQPGTIHYTTEISVPFTDSDEKYQGPPISGTALLEDVITRPEATFTTASNDQIGTLADGKTASDLIDGDITYTPDADNPTTIKVTGTLKPNEWQQFSTDTSLQKGYYLPITITPNLEGAGLEYRSTDAALGSDDLTTGKTLIVFVPADKSPIKVTVIEFLDEFQKETTYTLDLSGLTLIPFPQPSAEPTEAPQPSAAPTAQPTHPAATNAHPSSVPTTSVAAAAAAAPTPNPAVSPKTGDTAADMMTLLIIAGASGAVIAFLSVKRLSAKAK